MSGTMVVAVPTDGEAGLGGRRSGHFGHCDRFTVVTVEAGEIIDVRAVENPEHGEGGCLRPVTLLSAEGVDALIVAGMGARPLSGFAEAGIAVYFESRNPGVGDAISMLVSGELPRMEPRQACGGGCSGH